MKKRPGGEDRRPRQGSPDDGEGRGGRDPAGLPQDSIIITAVEPPGGGLGLPEGGARVRINQTLMGLPQVRDEAGAGSAPAAPARGPSGARQTLAGAPGVEGRAPRVNQTLVGAPGVEGRAPRVNQTLAGVPGVRDEASPEQGAVGAGPGAGAQAARSPTGGASDALASSGPKASGPAQGLWAGETLAPSSGEAVADAGPDEAAWEGETLAGAANDPTADTGDARPARLWHGDTLMAPVGERAPTLLSVDRGASLGASLRAGRGASIMPGDLRASMTGMRPYKPEDVIERIGPYEVVRELGRGGMGVVYKAYEPALGRYVALKVILGEAAPSPMAVARFINEALLTARLQHPNIVRVYDAGETEQGTSYFAMEYIDGRDLGDYLERGLVQDSPLVVYEGDAELEALVEGRLTLRRAVELIEQAARALDVAHAEGIVHRDIKPDNLLIDDARLEAHLMDFGIAKAVEDERLNLTTVGDIMGTPYYMSPEQANGELSAIGPRSDVYSLGAMLYHVLTGKVPFDGPSAMAVLLKVVNDQPPRPNAARRDAGLAPAPLDLETICLKAIEKEAAQRYASAGAFADDLAAALRGDPISARPLGRLELLQRRLKRNRGVLIALLAVSLLAVTLTTAFGLSLAGTIDRTSESLRELDSQQAISQAVTLENAIRVNMLQGRADLARDLVQRLRADETVDDIEVARPNRTPAYTDAATRAAVETRLNKPDVMAWILERWPQLADEIEALRERGFPNIDQSGPRMAASEVDVDPDRWEALLAAPEPRTITYEADYQGRPHLIVLKPIENAAECQACHGERTDNMYRSNHLRAVLIVRRPLDALEATIADNRQATWMIAAGTIAAVLVLLLAIGRFFGIGLGGERRFGARRARKLV